MVLQSESVDEDLEHFEDIMEETDNEPSTTPKKEEIEVDLVENGDKIDSESDSAEDEDDSPATSSEDDVSDEEELLMEDSSKELQESQPQSDHNGNQPQINSSGSSLPAGYDPRHREPCYWYVVFSAIKWVHLGFASYNVYVVYMLFISLDKKEQKGIMGLFTITSRC
jgi:ribosome biogenesis protein MAK21